MLKRILRTAIAAFVFFASRCAQAAIGDGAVSAQSAAMGGASLANMGDSAALFLNPAAGAGLANPEAYFMYNQLYAGLSGVGSLGQGFAAFGVPTKIGAVGVGLSDFQASGLLDQKVIGVTFSRRLFGAVDFGLTGKYLHQSYLIGSDPSAASDPVFSNGTARGAFALDAGLIAHVTNDLHVGLAVRNINQPDMGLASVDRVPREIQAGLAYDLKADALRLTADYTYTSAQAGTLTDRSLPGIGLEKGLVNDRVKFRVGLTLEQISAGVGIQFGPVAFDYTFLLSRTILANNAGTHMVGIRYRFGDAAQSASRSP
jgi:hypothetical protein